MEPMLAIQSEQKEERHMLGSAAMKHTPDWSERAIKTPRKIVEPQIVMECLLKEFVMAPAPFKYLQFPQYQV